MKSIQVFEYSTLRVSDKVDEGSFDQSHFESLAKYNDRHGRKYFSVGHKRITFKQYVGVIKVGNLAIEVLPKLDRNSANKKGENFWQSVLIEMLQACRILKPTTTGTASLRTHSSRLLDIIYWSFLQEVENILRSGKLKQYRRTTGNLRALKGRLLFSQNISRNLIHKEYFFTDHQTYTHDNFFNQALRESLKVIRRTALSHHLIAESQRLLLEFDEVRDRPLKKSDFANIVYRRSSEKYRHAIQLAELIIFSQQPDIRAGAHEVIALLFDMNLLFEEYVYRLLRRDAVSEEWSYDIKFQNGKEFWNHKRIRPDLILTETDNDSKTSFIIDTKWKVPDDHQPNDADLKQIFVYNMQFNAKYGFLVYPQTQSKQEPNISAYKKSLAVPEHTHHCEMLFFNIFDDSEQKENYKKLDRNAGVQILEYLESLIEDLKQSQLSKAT